MSEITWAGDDTLVVIERDDLATDMVVKRLYAFSVRGVPPAVVGDVPPVLSKWLVRDMVTVDGYPFEKAEGVALIGKDVYVMNDDDGEGVDPTQWLVLRKLAEGLGAH